MKRTVVNIDGAKLKRDCDAWCDKHGISYQMLSTSAGQSKSWLGTACDRNVITREPFNTLMRNTGLKAKEYLVNVPTKQIEAPVDSKDELIVEVQEIKALLQEMIAIWKPAEKENEHGTI